MVEHGGYWASFLLCVWGIAEQLLCNKTFQSRGITSQDLFVPRRHLSMCTEELEPSRTLGRAARSCDVPLTLWWRGAGDQILKSPWKWRGCFHYYLEESSDDNRFLCSLHDREQMYGTNLSLAQKHRPVGGHHLSLDSLWEQRELSHASLSWNHFIFQLLNPCCV